MPRQQVALKQGREPLQIEIPETFAGIRSTNKSAIHLHSSRMVELTTDEINFCQSFIQELPYRQSLTLGAVILDHDDPMLTATHAQISQLELDASLPNSEYAQAGGQRSTIERVLLIREAGCFRSLQASLAAA